MKILIIGGAGYIGSHMTKTLAQAGYDLVILDNFSTGEADVGQYGKLYKGNAGNVELLKSILTDCRCDAVMHFASYIQVGESIKDPAKYYLNNVCETVQLLEAIRSSGVRFFIFSSTAAVYGNPLEVPITESHPLLPINPYGRSKLMVEQILSDYQVYGLKYVSLRYFNAAGCDPEGEFGENHEPETHLIPLILQVASGKRKDIAVFGRDYPTRDGTCIRDYVHVMDIANAHRLALEYLLAGGNSAAFNLGQGKGHTVQEVINCAEKVTQRKIAIREALPREGDPSELVADLSRARKVLGWSPNFTDLESLIEHAWLWEQSRSNRVP